MCWQCICHNVFVLQRSIKGLQKAIRLRPSIVKSLSYHMKNLSMRNIFSCFLLNTYCLFCLFSSYILDKKYIFLPVLHSTVALSIECLRYFKFSFTSCLEKRFRGSIFTLMYNCSFIRLAIINDNWYQPMAIADWSVS